MVTFLIWSQKWLKISQKVTNFFLQYADWEMSPICPLSPHLAHIDFILMFVISLMGSLKFKLDKDHSGITWFLCVFLLSSHTKTKHRSRGNFVIPTTLLVPNFKQNTSQLPVSPFGNKLRFA